MFDVCDIGDTDLTPLPLLVPLQEYPWMPTGSVFIRLTYTPRSSSGNVANSQFGLFGGDFGLNENLKNKKNDVSIIMFE